MSRTYIGSAPIDMATMASVWDDVRKEILSDFYNEVCDRAEANMAATGTVSGAHWNAMRQVLKEKGVEVTR